MSIAWFGCEAGASGDMFLGALVDAGAPLDVMQSAVDAIGVEHVALRAREVTRAGLAATQVEVRTPRSDVVRTWGNIRGLLENADLDEAVRARSLDVFARLARAESVAHRVSPEQVHFHEVGALDAIADVVGSSAGLHALGVERAVASAVAVGSGMVRSEHGLLPVPAPAVLSVLAEADAPIHAGPVALEMCTPTGAALLAATVTSWGGLPPMRVLAHGAGAGSRDHDDVAERVAARARRTGRPHDGQRPRRPGIDDRRPWCSSPTSTTSTRDSGPPCSPHCSPPARPTRGSRRS